MINRILKLTGYVAVSRDLLPLSYRKNNPDKVLKLGKRVYYIVHPDCLPKRADKMNRIANSSILENEWDDWGSWEA